MIKIEDVEICGIMHAIRGMRNPKNSWLQSDSGYGCDGTKCTDCTYNNNWCGHTPKYFAGEKDLTLMKQLVKAGTDHSKFMRMITLSCDITAPLYWWKECDTYRFGVEKGSCSTMHTLHKRDLTLDDFSTERICPRYIPELESLISAINDARRQYIETNDKDFWYSMIQLLPSSYNQKRTIMASYQALRNMYHARKNHKLEEWRFFCDTLEKLPLSVLITIDL